MKRKNWKKVISLLLVVTLIGVVFVGCTTNDTNNKSDEQYISVIAKGFQHQFWQVVKLGSEQAAKDLGVKIYFTGPEGESAQSTQVDMLNAELAKNPSAIALAALNTEAVLSQLKEAADKNIPVIGFDSGVPNAPAGQIAANASTDNENAAGLGAEKMYEALQATVKAATTASPVVITVLSQDATSASITGRTKGFTNRMYDLVTADGIAAAVSGDYAAVNKGDAATAAVRIEVVVGATPDITDMTNAANGVLNTNNLVGVFCSNEGAVNGLLAAVNAGSVLSADVKVVGFDAGAGQKAAVKNGVFLGSITQDPFQIGYKAVELAVKASKGEAVQDVDTGAKWYDSSNMEEADIAQLLYD